MKLTITHGDLLDQDVDVIVNAWNRNIIPWWPLLPQGVSGAIKRRVKTNLFRELTKHGSVFPAVACSSRRKGWKVQSVSLRRCGFRCCRRFMRGQCSCHWNRFCFGRTSRYNTARRRKTVRCGSRQSDAHDLVRNSLNLGFCCSKLREAGMKSLVCEAEPVFRVIVGFRPFGKVIVKEDIQV